ncbi:MAG: hypothetical protein WCY21_00530 [Candidatus Cloacimonadaceae bacterium]|jgi:uncharacterized protein YacL|nr:hypothetical protein [Candidatus Cloacimonadota bacterium]MDX9950224.1 hypothetical protein [Candidatus Syntrophosphaera sp.]
MLALQIILYLILVLLNILDGVSTWKVVRPRHLHRERNPVARWMFAKLGLLPGLILAELLWISFITAVVFLLGSFPVWGHIVLILLILGITIFTWIVVGNFKNWRGIRGRQLAQEQGSETKKC